jgi:hypothetical protein
MVKLPTLVEGAKASGGTAIPGWVEAFTVRGTPDEVIEPPPLEPERAWSQAPELVWRLRAAMEV